MHVNIALQLSLTSAVSPHYFETRSCAINSLQVVFQGLPILRHIVDRVEHTNYSPYRWGSHLAVSCVVTRQF